MILKCPKCETSDFADFVLNEHFFHEYSFTGLACTFDVACNKCGALFQSKVVARDCASSLQEVKEEYEEYVTSR